MDLYLVRHGQPDWAPDRVARNDPGLTPLGREQAARVAHRLSSLDRFDDFWSSPMRRSMETSDPVEIELRREREVYEWLREIQNPPEWDGEPVDEIEKRFETAHLRSLEEMWDGLPGGESFRSFHQRVVDGLVRTLDTHGIHPAAEGSRHLWSVEDPDRRVVVVAHAGTNAVVFGHLLGLDPVPWEWDRFQQPHTGVSRLTTIRVSTDWAFSLRQMGDVSHLAPGMITS